MMKTVKKILSILLSILILVSVLSVPVFADTEFVKAEYTQTHTVKMFKTAYAFYKLMYGKSIGSPLDGTYGNPDMCIPGLAKSEGMVPQGISYWEEEDLFVISAHGSKDGQGSVIFLLDGKTGELKRQYSVYTTALNVSQAHLGGIAVTKNNLYITYGNSRIAYIPLEQLKSDSPAIVVSEGKKTVTALNGANTSYLSYSDGYLWTGNYFSNEESYNTRVSEENASAVFGFKIEGDTSEEEWNKLDSAEPTYTLNVSDSINKIQGVAVSGNNVYINSSSGKKNDSTLYSGVVDLNAEGIQLSESNLNSHNTLPMAECLCFKDGYLYTLMESAAAEFSGAKNPSDVVWKIPVSSLNDTIDSLGLLKRINDFYYKLLNIIKSLLGK